MNNWTVVSKVENNYGEIKSPPTFIDGDVN